MNTPTQSFIPLLCICALSLYLGGCGLYDDIPGFIEPLTVACGDPCGPCDLGEFDCEVEQCSFIQEGLGSDAICGGEGAQVAFVNTSAPQDGDGSRDAPFKMLSDALALPSASLVLVAGTEPIPGPVELTDGLTLLGGWTPSFTRDAGLRPLIKTPAPDDDHAFGVIAQKLDRPTYVEGFEVRIEGSGREIQRRAVGARGQGLAPEEHRLHRRARRRWSRWRGWARWGRWLRRAKWSRTCGRLRRDLNLRRRRRRGRRRRISPGHQHPTRLFRR